MTGPNALSPAEALVLIDPAVRPRDALKATLMALMAGRRLRLENRPIKASRFLNREPVLRADQPSARDPRHESSVLEIVRSEKNMTMGRFFKKAQRAYGSEFRGFVKHVAALLMRRGLLIEVKEPFLFFFKRTRLRHTPAGEIERRRLENLMAQARNIPNLLASDPRTAAAMAVALGALVFAAPDLQPHLAQLGAAIRDHGAHASSGGDSSVSNSSTVDSSSAPTSELLPSTEQIDLSNFDWNSFDSAALDEMSASMETLDASFESSSSDSGGGDSGGDSGSGDGGGD